MLKSLPQGRPAISRASPSLTLPLLLTIARCNNLFRRYDRPIRSSRWIPARPPIDTDNSLSKQPLTSSPLPLPRRPRPSSRLPLHKEDLDAPLSVLGGAGRGGRARQLQQAEGGRERRGSLFRNRWLASRVAGHLLVTRNRWLVSHFANQPETGGAPTRLQRVAISSVLSCRVTGLPGSRRRRTMARMRQLTCVIQSCVVA